MDKTSEAFLPIVFLRDFLAGDDDGDRRARILALHALRAYLDGDKPDLAAYHPDAQAAPLVVVKAMSIFDQDELQRVLKSSHKMLKRTIQHTSSLTLRSAAKATERELSRITEVNGAHQRMLLIGVRHYDESESLWDPHIWVGAWLVYKPTTASLPQDVGLEDWATAFFKHGGDLTLVPIDDSHEAIASITCIVAENRILGDMEIEVPEEVEEV